MSANKSQILYALFSGQDLGGKSLDQITEAMQAGLECPEHVDELTKWIYKQVQDSDDKDDGQFHDILTSMKYGQSQLARAEKSLENWMKQ